MIQSRKFQRGVLAAVMASLTLLIGGPALAQGNPPVKLGVLMGFTGPAAFQAGSTMVAIRMGVKEINDAGGLLGRRVEIIQADDQFNPAQSVNEARRLAQQERVNFVLGPQASTLALAVAPVFTEARIPYFSTSVAAVPSAYNFPTMMSTTSQAQSMANFAANVLHAKTAAYLSDNGAAGKALVPDFQKLLPGLGIELKGVQEHDTRTADITPQVLALRRLNPEVLLHSTSTGEDGGLLLKTLADIGWNVPVVSTSIAQATAGALKVAGPDAFKPGRYYGLIATAYTYCASDKVGDRAYDRYLAKLKAFDPENFDKLDHKSTLYLYDSLMLIRAAVEGSKSVDGPTLVSWIEKNGSSLRGGAGYPMAPNAASHFLMGPNAISFVTRPDLPRPSDKLIERTAGC
ncbi:MAG TPA: ABC transporter substrate-binding protein [Burkholderiales bacterium]|nr:ABC transporter substrate-binding protein [Burkholderiales bacterium]